MRTPASISGHPIHPMLVTLPIGLWVFSFVADLLCLRGVGPGPETWAVVAYYTMIGGIVGALLAAVPGLIDLTSIKDPAIKKTGLVHMGINLTVVVIYIVNVCLRYSATEVRVATVLMSGVTILLLLVSGWLGGKMVYLGRVAVTEPGQ